MVRMRRLLLCIVICGLYSIPSFARPKWKLLNVELGGIRFTPIESRDKTNAFIDFAWTPLWDAENYAFHGSFQVTATKDNDTNLVLVTSYQAGAIVRIYSIFAIDVSGGLQTLHGSGSYGGTHPIAGGAFLLRVGEEVFDRLYIGFYRLFRSGDEINEFRTGTSFTF